MYEGCQDVDWLEAIVPVMRRLGVRKAFDVELDAAPPAPEKPTAPETDEQRQQRAAAEARDHYETLIGRHITDAEFDAFRGGGE